MGWQVTYALTCDSCGTVGPQRPSGAEPDAETTAANEGWRVVKPRFLVALHCCPACAAAGRWPKGWPLAEEFRA